jgi:hypothetical protein
VPFGKPNREATTRFDAQQFLFLNQNNSATAGLDSETDECVLDWRGLFRSVANPYQKFNVDNSPTDGGGRRRPRPSSTPIPLGEQEPRSVA